MATRRGRQVAAESSSGPSLFQLPPPAVSLRWERSLALAVMPGRTGKDALNARASSGRSGSPPPVLLRSWRAGDPGLGLALLPAGQHRHPGRLQRGDLDRPRRRPVDRRLRPGLRGGRRRQVRPGGEPLGQRLQRRLPGDRAPRPHRHDARERHRRRRAGRSLDGDLAGRAGMDPDDRRRLAGELRVGEPRARERRRRDLDISPDGTVWFALLGFGGDLGGIVRHTPATTDWHYWTGGLGLAGRATTGRCWSGRAPRLDPAQAGRRLHRLGRQRQQLGARLLRQHDPALDLPRVLLHARGHARHARQGLRRRQRQPLDAALRRLHRQRRRSTRSTTGRRPAPGSCRPQPALPAVDPPIWAFRAFGDGQALLADGAEPGLALQRRRLAGPRHLARRRPRPATSPSTAPATSGPAASAARRSATR